MKKLTQAEFLEKAISVHGNEKYDYSLSIYTINRAKIVVICKKHGSFDIKADCFMQGQGCRDCAHEDLGTSRRASAEEILKKFSETHGNRYDYSLMIYVNIDTKIKIICSEHGIFEQVPYNHIIGQGCAKCVFIVSLDQFIEKSKEIHKDKYNYSLVIYQYQTDKIKIICPIHGLFEQRANDHLQGKGCPSCSHVISKLEITWLDQLKIPMEQRHQLILVNDKKYNVDAFDPITNTIYEFYGDFWHGNPKRYDLNAVHGAIKNKTYGDIYHRTMNRENILREAGYNLIIIWETDFLNSNKMI